MVRLWTQMKVKFSNDKSVVEGKPMNQMSTRHERTEVTDEMIVTRKDTEQQDKWHKPKKHSCRILMLRHGA